jgi:HAD superfamily hydrolase (TIGR01549 family)
MIRGVILDVDGTLVLSNDAHAWAIVQAFGEAGYHVPFEQVRPLIGMGTGKLIRSIEPDLSPDDGVGKQIKERQTEIFLDRFAPHLVASPGTRELVEYMEEQGLKLAIGTSAKQQELDILLKIAGIDDLVKIRTSASDVETAKPAPDIVQAAVEKLDLSPDGVMMLGDTPFDIESAARSDVETIAVTCGGWSRDQLAGARAVYDSPADLLAHYMDSPLAVTAW